MARLIASFFGTGLILGRVRGSDTGSGTVGAAFAVVVAFWIGQTGGWLWVLAGAVGLLVAGFWSIRRVVNEVGDAGWIVIDEAAGAFVAVLGVTLIPAVIAAFVMFRLADIAKHWFPGVAASERLPGSVGVIGDDFVAGLYGLAAGHLIQALL